MVTAQWPEVGLHARAGGFGDRQQCVEWAEEHRQVAEEAGVGSSAGRVEGAADAASKLVGGAEVAGDVSRKPARREAVHERPGGDHRRLGVSGRRGRRLLQRSSAQLERARLHRRHQLRIVALQQLGPEHHLEMTVPAAFAGSGAGARYVGPGGDVALLGLAL